jgi:hypothetical protein
MSSKMTRVFIANIKNISSSINLLLHDIAVHFFLPHTISFFLRNTVQTQIHIHVLALTHINTHPTPMSTFERLNRLDFENLT